MGENRKLFDIACKHCGAPVGFDIPSQSYKCVHCGELSNYREAIVEQEANWKGLNAQQWGRVHREEVTASCSGCGAIVIFPKGEASETCAFCGSNLMQSDLLDDAELPEYIIPFVLTEEEAKKQLSDWCDHQRDNTDIRRVKQNIKHLEGYYLPYRLIRGSLEGIAYRDLLSRNFHYNGYLDHALVNASEQLDNAVLDAAEPFDLSELKPFDPVYIGGQKVKLSDVSDAEVRRRTMEEATQQYRPYVTKVLHNRDAEIRVDEGDFMHVPILLPVYVQKVGHYLAVVNGQTGKVAVDSRKKDKESKLWLVEPTVLTLIAALAAGFFLEWDLFAMLMAGILAGIVFFISYGQDRNGVMIRKIYKGKDSSASRKDGELELKQGDVLKNAFPSTPVFYETEGDRKVQVEYRFYTPGRVVNIVIRLLLLIFLPAILATLIHFARGGSMQNLNQLQYMYGAAWYMVTGGVAIIYFIRGFRWDIFNRPIMYEILPDGKRKLFGSRKSRTLTIRSTFGLESGQAIRELGGLAVGMVVFAVFILLGSTLAIVF